MSSLIIIMLLKKSLIITSCMKSCTRNAFKYMEEALAPQQYAGGSILESADVQAAIGLFVAMQLVELRFELDLDHQERF